MKLPPKEKGSLNSLKNKPISAKSGILIFEILTFSTFSILSINGAFSRIVEGINLAENKIIDSLFYLFNQDNDRGKNPCFYKKNSNEKNSNENEKTKLIITGQDYLKCYHEKNYSHLSLEDRPPTGVVLDELLSRHPKESLWRTKNFNTDNDNAYLKMEKKYRTFFEVIDRRLEAYTVNQSETFTISTKFLPDPEFQTSENNDIDSQNLDLPIEAVNWIKYQQNRHKQLKLVDTFVLLMMLGTLGSIIFLLSQHIENESNIPIKSYILKPIFGMFLAISTFIVSFGVSYLVSASSAIETFKVEGVLLLAFGSGLLSEQTYKFLTKKTGEALKDTDKADTAFDSQENTKSSDTKYPDDSKK